MMNITCAYCHNKGHHIKFCAELAEKNRRRDAYKPLATVKPLASGAILLESRRENVKPLKRESTNIFANLGFSSEEEEEGEIVEEESKFRRKSFEDDASVSSSFSVGSESFSVGSVDSWSRRGTKGIVVHIPQVTHGQDNSGLDSDEEYTPSDGFLRFLESSREFLSQYDGVAWIDI